MFNQIPKGFNPPLRSPYYFIRIELLKKVAEYATQLQGKLLDFGCGQKPYKSLFTNVSEYIGLDFENEGHSHQNEQIDFFYDGKTIPFDNETFDSIFTSEVFEHVFNLHEILLELNRVLKPKGKILITCPFVWNEHEVPHDYARYTQFALKDILEKNDFKIIKLDKSGDFATALHQMRMVYLSEHRINTFPLFGKIKFISTNIRPLIIFLNNLYFQIKRPLFPKRLDFYLNNVVLAEKK